MKSSSMAKVDDGFVNLVANLGTTRDKVSGGSWGYSPTTAGEAEAIYRSSWLGRKIVDTPVSDMVREWRTWSAGGEIEDALVKEERRLGLKHKIASAIRLARIAGGAAIVLSDGTTDPSKPIGDNAKPLSFIHVLSMDQMGYHELSTDPLSPTYGMPDFWTIQSGKGAGVSVHSSRVIVVRGAERPVTSAVIDPWGDSVYDAIRDALLNSATASSAIATMLTEAKIDVVTMPGLAGALSDPAGEARLLRRFQTAATLKGINGVLILGEGEEYDQKQMTFSGLPDVHLRFLQEVAGAADIPMSRLMGQSVAGLNSKGEADIRNYYDSVAGMQETIILPILDRIDPHIRAAAKIAPENALWEFSELWQVSDLERAEIFAKTAASIKTLAEAAVMPDSVLSQAAVAMLDRDGIMPGLAGMIEAGAADDDDEPG
jgi:phage-related protein (TIGR01555 family)